MGTSPGYGTIQFDPKALTNILSLKFMKEKYHMSYDSNEQGRFIDTKPDGEGFTFVLLEMGLHYLNSVNHQ